MAQRQNGALQIWLTPQAGARVSGGGDPAGGGAERRLPGGQVIDLTTGLQCAESQRAADAAEAASAKPRSWRANISDALLAVERNNQGEAVLAYLRAICRYERIFQVEQAGWLADDLRDPAG